MTTIFDGSFGAPDWQNISFVDIPAGADRILYHMTPPDPPAGESDTVHLCFLGKMDGEDPVVLCCGVEEGDPRPRRAQNSGMPLPIDITDRVRGWRRYDQIALVPEATDADHEPHIRMWIETAPID